MVDAHRVFIHSRVLFSARVLVYTQRGFLHCLFGYMVFSGPQQRISNKRKSAFLMVKELYFRFRNLILYGIIGGFCAALDFGVYTALCQFGIMPYLLANIISIHVGIFTSFALNRSINFKVKDKTAQRFLSFYAVGLTGLGISELMLYLMVTLGEMNELLCKLISIVVVALIQFILNKYITFKKQTSNG